MKLLGFEITIKKIKKKSVKLTDKELMEKAIKEYVGRETSISGICGCCDRAIIIGFEGIQILNNGTRRVIFKTNSEEYPYTYINETQICSR